MNEARMIRKASDPEIELLIGIWKEKVRDLEARGIGVWDVRQFSRESLDAKYGRPEYFIGLIEGRAFGGFILLESDIHFWPGADEPAYYFHKFVVRTEFGGRGLSRDILDWVKDHGRENGKAYIRLDFNENRDYLRRLYYGNGFEFVAVHSEKGQDRIVLAQHAIARESGSPGVASRAHVFDPKEGS